MALLYPWATKEYLLWQMSLGQVIMYYNLGMDAKYPQPKEGNGILSNKSHEQLKDLKKELKQLGLTSDEQPVPQPEKSEAEMRMDEKIAQELARRFGKITDD